MVFGLLRITDGDISSPLSGADKGWLLPFRSEPAGGAVAMSLALSAVSISQRWLHDGRRGSGELAV